MKMRKVYEKNNNDDEGQWTNCDQKNWLEPSALNIPYINKNCILPSTEWCVLVKFKFILFLLLNFFNGRGPNFSLILITTHTLKWWSEISFYQAYIDSIQATDHTHITEKVL